MSDECRVNLTKTDEYAGPVPDADVEIALKVLRTVRGACLTKGRMSEAVILSHAHRTLVELVQEAVAEERREQAEAEDKQQLTEAYLIQQQLKDKQRMEAALKLPKDHPLRFAMLYGGEAGKMQEPREEGASYQKVKEKWAEITAANAIKKTIPEILYGDASLREVSDPDLGELFLNCCEPDRVLNIVTCVGCGRGFDWPLDGRSATSTSVSRTSTYCPFCKTPKFRSAGESHGPSEQAEPKAQADDGSDQLVR